MRRAFYSFSLATCFLVTKAMAQDVPSGGPPPPRIGFQMAVRTGYQIPMGEARGAMNDDGDGLAMSDFVSGQVPLFMELGGKPIPNLFLGGYLGMGIGGAAGQMDTICNSGGVTCSSVGLRLGATVQYHILPGQTANPWLGYGAGFESQELRLSQGGQKGTISFSGFEYAHLMAGVDFRLSREFGIGPFVDFSIGEYSRYRGELPGVPLLEGDVPNTTTHQWLAFGARATFFP